MKKLLLLFSFLLCVVSASATTYTVKQAGGGNFLTVGGCAGTAVAGDTCVIYAGTYNETVSPTNSGSAGNPITYTINPGDTVTVTQWSLNSGSTYLVIHGTAANPMNVPSGITWADHITHNVFQYISTTTGGCWGGSAWYTSHTPSSFNQFLNSTINNCGGTPAGPAIEIQGDHNLFDSITCNNAQACITYSGQFNVIRNNRFTGTSAAILGGAHSQPIENSVSCGPDVPGGSQHTLIENNYSVNWLGGDSHALLLMTDTSPNGGCGTMANIIRLNTGMASGAYAIVSYDTGTEYFYNNSWSNTQLNNGSKDHEDYLNQTPNDPSLRTINNIFSNMTNISSSSWCIYTDATPIENHNLCFNSGGPGTWFGPTTAATNSYAPSDVFNVDPLFVNANTDLHLQAGSPAIGAGGPLTTAVGAGTSSTSLTVVDAGFFSWGYGIVQGDWIRIGASTTVQISNINYSTNVMTLASAVSWTNGNPIYLYKDSSGNILFSTANPSIGAFSPSGGGAPVLTQTVAQPVNQGQTFTFSCATNCGTGGTWSVSGTNASGGTVAAAGSINSSTGVYTAPALVTPQQSLGGCQVLANNDILNSNISALAVNANNAAWLAQADTNAVVFTSSSPNNYIDNTVGNQNVMVTNNPTANGIFQILGPPLGDIENGWYNSTGSDAHYYTVNHQTCVFQELYGPSGLSTGNFATTFGGIAPYSGTAYPIAVGSGLGWSGADVAGLKMMAIQLHLQEMNMAIINGTPITHAIRVTMPNGEIHNCNVFTENVSFIWPAANPSCSGSGLIPQGARFRLKASYNCSALSTAAQIICTQLKNYGGILDDGGFAYWNFVIDEDYWNFHPEIQELINAHMHPTDFEFVEVHPLMLDKNSGECACNREIATYTSNTGSASVDIIPVGVTLGTPYNVVNFEAGAGARQLTAWVNGNPNTAVTWSKPLAASIQYAGSVGGQNAFGGPYNSVSTAQNTITGGSLSIVCVDQGNIATIPDSVTDLGGNIYTHWAALDSNPISVWYNLNTSGFANDMWTARWNTLSGNFLGIIQRQYNSGGSIISADVAPVPTVTGSTTSPFVSNVFTTTGTNEIISPCVHLTSSNTFTLGTIAGVAAEGLSVDNPNPGTAQLAMEDVVIPNIASGVTASIAFATGATPGVMSIATFKGTGGTPITGTLTSGGLYTPPTNVSSGGGEAVSTILTVKSVANPAVLATIQLNIFPVRGNVISLFSTSPSASTLLGWPFPITVGGVTWQDMTNAWTNGATLNPGGCAGSPPWPSQGAAYIYRNKMDPQGDERFNIFVQPGIYTVVSKFGECYWATGNSEHTNPEVNGTRIFTNLNVFNAAGGRYIPYDLTTINVNAASGQLSYVLRSVNGYNNGISALQIINSGPINGTTVPAGVTINPGVVVK
jgi:hypothetical protein